jgi:Bifunctional DNA primase/polymerase, N-terminal
MTPQAPCVGKVEATPTRATGTLKRHALDFLKRGWSIIPVRGKKAAIEWRQFQERRMSETDLIAGLALGGVTGMAVILGEISGHLYCRDFDVLEAYERWARSHSELSRQLPTVRTWRGMHVYFRDRVGRKPHKYEDGELRGNGCYCVLPPSKHPEGSRYEWVHHLSPLGAVPEIDAKLADLLGQEFKDATEGMEGIEGTEVTEGIEESHVVRESATAPKSILEAVACCVPQREHENHPCLFKLARGLLTLQQRLNIEDDSSIVNMRTEAFNLWWERSKGFTRAGVSREHYWEKFLDGCEDAKYPLGGATLEMALQRARQSTPPLEAVQSFTNPKLLLLASLCRELQSFHHPRPFFLSCQRAAGLLDLPNPMEAHRCFKRLKAVRILKEVEKGSLSKATRYRYLLPLNEGSITDPKPITSEKANSNDREVIDL